MNRSQVGDDTVNCQDVVVLELCPHIHFVLIALYGTSVKVVVSRINKDYNKDYNIPWSFFWLS